MLTYLSDLMEDTTDFSWQGAKASHAVLLCEMERGAVTWSDTGRIDQIRRAHAQKHVKFFGRSNVTSFLVEVMILATSVPGFASFFSQVHVVIVKIMRLMVDFIGTYVLIA